MENSLEKPQYRFAAIHDPAELAELRFLMQLEVNAEHLKEAMGTQSRIEVIDRFKSYFESALTDGSYIGAVAEVGGRLISANGCVVYRKPPGLAGGEGLVAYVTNVYTRPEWRKRGIAQDLMKMIVDRARAMNLDKLHLGATEDGAGVYERVGFKSVRFKAMELRFR